MDVKNYLFEKEALKGERTALHFRWILIVVVLLFIAITYFRGDKAEALWSFVPATLFLAYNFLLTYLIRKGQNFYFVRYFSVSVDIIALTFHIYINSRFFSPIAVATTASIFIYPVIMFLSVLRYDKKLIVYATLLTLTMINLNYFIQYQTINKDLINQVISSDPMGQIYRSGYILLLGYFFLKIPDMVYRFITKQKEALEEKNEYIVNLLIEKTEKKALETNLNELNFLHDELKNKAEEIEEQNLKLNDLVQTRDRLISFISHDLKNSFSTMSSIVETARDNLENLDPNEIWKIMDVLHKHSITNHILFENLLQWARLQRGQISVNKQKVNVQHFCRTIFEQHQAAFFNKELTYQAEIEENLFVLADPFLLTSVFNNLIGNSIKFSYRGSSVSIQAIMYGDEVKISIIDQGIGIKEEKLKEIFNIRNSKSLKGTEGETGSGFGLILCRDLVERMGGKLEIISREGKGCSVSVFLKRTEINSE